MNPIKTSGTSGGSTDAPTTFGIKTDKLQAGLAGLSSLTGILGSSESNRVNRSEESAILSQTRLQLADSRDTSSRQLQQTMGAARNKFGSEGILGGSVNGFLADLAADQARDDRVRTYNALQQIRAIEAKADANEKNPILTTLSGVATLLETQIKIDENQKDRNDAASTISEIQTEIANTKSRIDTLDGRMSRSGAFGRLPYYFGFAIPNKVR